VLLRDAGTAGAVVGDDGTANTLDDNAPCADVRAAPTLVLLLTARGDATTTRGEPERSGGGALCGMAGVVGACVDGVEGNSRLGDTTVVGGGGFNGATSRDGNCPVRASPVLPIHLPAESFEVTVITSPAANANSSLDADACASIDLT
jgi:hypothetical protein